MVVANQVLRRCGVPSVSYLLRVVSPVVMYDIAKAFDGWVMDAYLSKHSLAEDCLTEEAKLQLVLPTRCSGMGLTDHLTKLYYAPLCVGFVFLKCA